MSETVQQAKCRFLGIDEVSSKATPLCCPSQTYRKKTEIQKQSLSTFIPVFEQVFVHVKRALLTIL